MIYTVCHQIIAGTWIVFVLYWIVAATGTKRTAEKMSRASQLAYRWPIWICVLIYFVPNVPLNQAITPTNDVEELMGAGLCVAGILFAIWARRTIAGNWSSSVTFKADHELIQSGPYQYVRHPIYTGLILMAVGTALGTGQVRSWICLAGLTLAFWIKLRQEEQLMLRHFPNDYPAYRSRVKALIPFIL